ncbi:MAG TPA: hypothetical protein PLY70_04430 [Saprospiraceae bacterium]|nr:hypothetical protein [Saprospiraceae bacterium]HPN68313.1 hypothetical protein [Saprospiraceae bacterium]
MKSWACLIIIFCGFVNGKGQDTIKYFVNKIPLDSIKVEYVQIVGRAKFLSTKPIIELDFGQYNDLFLSADTQIVDGMGKRINLNSMIEALNFMVKNGYEYVNSYVVSEENQNVYHYLLRRIKSD